MSAVVVLLPDAITPVTVSALSAARFTWPPVKVILASVSLKLLSDSRPLGRIVMRAAGGNCALLSQRISYTDADPLGVPTATRPEKAGVFADFARFNSAQFTRRFPVH